MRSSKLDPVMFTVCTGLFLYFFIFGYSMEYTYYHSFYGRHITTTAFHGGIVYSAIFALMFLLLTLFAEELRPVNRQWVKHKIKSAYEKLKDHCKEGLKNYKEWKNS